MTGLTIDHLTLRLHGADEDRARRLVQLVADGLAAAAGPAAPAAREAVRVRVEAAADSDLGGLAERIVRELLTALERT